MVPLTVAIIFALLYTMFQSVKQSVLVLANIPFSLVGGIAALWLRGLNLNLSASVGFIALFGVAVLNGVVLVNSINQLRKEGQSVRDAVMNGSRRRLRPVLMTALVASLGFVPMAIATSTGAEVQRHLATVVIGGLVSSTVLTVFLLPLLYDWMFARTEEKQRANLESERSSPDLQIKMTCASASVLARFPLDTPVDDVGPECGKAIAEMKAKENVPRARKDTGGKGKGPSQLVWALLVDLSLWSH